MSEKLNKCFIFAEGPAWIFHSFHHNRIALSQCVHFLCEPCGRDRVEKFEGERGGGREKSQKGWVAKLFSGSLGATPLGDLTRKTYPKARSKLVSSKGTKTASEPFVTTGPRRRRLNNFTIISDRKIQIMPRQKRHN